LRLGLAAPALSTTIDVPTMPYQSMCKKAIAAAQRTLRAASAIFAVGYVLSDVSFVYVEDPHFACYYWAKLWLII
jgi:hypothetical protein